MHTRIHPQLVQEAGAEQAGKLLTSCVHCGLCSDHCPSYQVLGNELDSPRGRIYLIHKLLTTNRAHRGLQKHLDTCLTCRACELVCPSGVRYGELLEFGRNLTEARQRRGFLQRVFRWLLCNILVRPRLFALLLRPAVFLRPLMPRLLQKQLPRPRPAVSALPGAARKNAKAKERVLLLAGCVQAAATPHTRAVLAKLVAHFGAEPVTLPRPGCCGALRLHLADAAGALRQIKAWIDAVSKLAETAEKDAIPLRILSSASGCGVTILDYPRILRAEQGEDLSGYIAKAEQLMARVQDASLWLAEKLATEKPEMAPEQRRVVLHEPCSLQHGLGRAARVREVLQKVGIEPLLPAESHLCCGSAGSYSLLQPKIADALRARKLGHIADQRPDLIVTANVGCQLYLDADSAVPTVHWLELLAERLDLQPLCPAAGRRQRQK